jgi:hypothetical protein
MRFTMDGYQLLAAGVTAFALAIGWHLGAWVMHKITSRL